MNNSRMDKLDAMMDSYIYGLVDRKTNYRICKKIENDPEWQLAYENAIDRKRMLTEVAGSNDSEIPTAASIAAKAVAGARGICAKRLRRRKIIRLWSGGLAAAATVLISVMWIAYAAISPPTHIVRITGQNELISGSTASLRAVVTDFANRPSEGIPVNLVLTENRENQEPRELVLASWKTDSNGVASGQVHLPAWEGHCHLTARAGNNSFQLITSPIKLKRASKVFLATDKPIYQPGQTIHMRSLVLQKGSLKPDTGRPVELAVTDPGNNVIFRETRTLSEYGLAWANLPLDSLITPGRYRITATAGSDISEQTVEISHYKLPAFSVKITTDKSYYRPGETLSGKVHLKYNFGKPVKGAKVELELIDRNFPLANIAGKITITAGDSGTAGFEIPLPATLIGAERTHQNAQLLLSAQATDPAGQENVGYQNIPVSPASIRIAVVAENGSIAQGLPGRLFVVTSYPDGKPAKTIVDIQSIGQSIRTDETGVAIIESENLPDTLRISARDDRGQTRYVAVPTPIATGKSLVLRTDKPVYNGGETIALQVIAGEIDQVFIDIVKDHQTILTKTVQVENGRGIAAIDIPPMLSGTLHLHAYRLDPEGGWIGRDAIVVVRQAGELKVAISSDKKTHRPGQDAELNFLVTDAEGKAQAAAISLAAVDEAVFSLQQSAPGLEGLLNGLDEELLIPAVEVHGFSMGLMQKSTPYARAVLAAAAGEVSKRNQPNSGQWTSSDPLHSLNASNEGAAMDSYYQASYRAGSNATITTICCSIGIVVAMVFFGISFVSPSIDIKISRYKTIIGLILIAALLLLLSIPATMSSSSVRLGGGEAQSDFNVFAVNESPRSGLPQAKRDLGKGKVAFINARPTPGGRAVRTRTYFPETMLWRPQIITDPQGRANLTVPLADSITTWRLSGSAVSKSGRLGRVSGSIRVFQPFFVDINAPTSLTRGDEISIPLVLYNYADKPLNVQIKCTGGSGLTVIGGVAGEVKIAPSEVSRVMVRVKANEIGAGTLKVLAVSNQLSDSIVRKIRIAPPGRPTSTVINGALVDGQQTIDVPLPVDAVEGSVAMRLKLYPSTFSELMDGLEGLFRQPYGCFEQTSSTTYPNVMALAYMRSNGLENPEATAKATRYIQMGYQRLLSFEIKGGGFDWFGRGPANVVLTAYGMMEFSDMAKVHNVDPNLLKRTAAWLAGMQSSGGGWKFTPGCFHEPFTGGDSGELATTAYVTWAIASYQSDHPAAVRGAAYINAHTNDITSTYTLALCANALKSTNSPNANELIEQLAKKAQTLDNDQVYWQSGSGRHDIKTTSLAILAMHGNKRYGRVINDALRWLASRRDPSGTWGATQSTIMALKALTQGVPAAGGKHNADIALTIGTIGSKRPPVMMNIASAESDAVHTATIEPATNTNRMQLNVTAQGAAGLPYQVVIHYHTLASTNKTKSPVQIKVDYDRTHLTTGQSVTVKATITNTSPTVANMLLADVGTPPGFSVSTTDLEKLRSAGKIERYTITASGVIFYITKLNARANTTLEYQMTAKIPLKAQSAPTTVYPYYEPQQLSSAPATMFTVQ